MSFADFSVTVVVSHCNNTNSRNPSCPQGNPKTLLLMSINFLHTFPDWKLKKMCHWPSSQHNTQWHISGVPPLHSQHTVCEKWMPQWCYSGRVLHLMWLWTLHMSKKARIPFNATCEWGPFSRLQCLSVQWSLLSVGPLGLACRCVPLQHRHRPLLPLCWPRQPLFPAPPSYATRGAGAQFHRAHCSRGKAIQCSIKCLSKVKLKQTLKSWLSPRSWRLVGFIYRNTQEPLLTFFQPV